MPRLDRDSERLAPLTPRAILAYILFGFAATVTTFGMIYASASAVVWVIHRVAP